MCVLNGSAEQRVGIDRNGFKGASLRHGGVDVWSEQTPDVLAKPRTSSWAGSAGRPQNVTRTRSTASDGALRTRTVMP
jgi:hypothetical protein